MDAQASTIIGFFLIGLGLIWIVTREASVFFGRDSERPWRRERSKMRLGYTNRNKLDSVEGSPVVILGVMAAVLGVLMIIFPEVLPTALENLQEILGPYVTIKTSP